MAAVAEVYQSATGGVRVKMHDKPAALEKLARALGMFTDKVGKTNEGMPVAPVLIIRGYPETESAPAASGRARDADGRAPPSKLSANTNELVKRSAYERRRTARSVSERASVRGAEQERQACRSQRRKKGAADCTAAQAVAAALLGSGMDNTVTASGPKPPRIAEDAPRWPDLSYRLARYVLRPLTDPRGPRLQPKLNGPRPLRSGFTNSSPVRFRSDIAE